jgi:hypothetical protein
MEILRAPWVMELDYVINRLGESLLATEVNLHRESRLFSIHVKKGVKFTREGARLLTTPQQKGKKGTARVSESKKRIRGETIFRPTQ